MTPELANVPLIVMDPDHRGYRINYTVGSQVDLAPSILDLLGIPAPVDQLCQGSSLYAARAKSRRTIYIDSLRQYGVVEDDEMFCGDREMGDAGAIRNIFKISNQGVRSAFVAIDLASNTPPPAISVFHRFQESLLRHYTRYCEDARQTPVGN